MTLNTVDCLELVKRNVGTPRATAGAISGPYASSSVVVGDGDILIDIELGLGFAVDGHVHRKSRVNLLPSA